jgi:hypothetical protein
MDKQGRTFKSKKATEDTLGNQRDLMMKKRKNKKPASFDPANILLNRSVHPCPTDGGSK